MNAMRIRQARRVFDGQVCVQRCGHEEPSIDSGAPEPWKKDGKKNEVFRFERKKLKQKHGFQPTFLAHFDTWKTPQKVSIGTS